MKALPRALLAMVGILVSVAVVRVAIVDRIAVMAQTWCGLSPDLPGPSPFSRTAFAVSTHGVAGDVVFLCVEYAPADEDNIRRELDASPGLSDPHSATLTIPLPAPTEQPCSDNGGLFRIRPDSLPSQNLPSCYRVTDRFDVDRVQQGEAWRISGKRGGLVVLDTARHRLYIAAYRTA